MIVGIYSTERRGSHLIHLVLSPHIALVLVQMTVAYFFVSSYAFDRVGKYNHCLFVVPFGKYITYPVDKVFA